MERENVTITSALNYLFNAISTERALYKGEKVVLYVPTMLYRKIVSELTQVQRTPDQSTEDGILLLDTFLIREESGLKYLERSIEQIRRIVT